MRFHLPRTTKVCGSLVVVALALVGCGGSASTSSTSPQASATTTTAGDTSTSSPQGNAGLKEEDSGGAPHEAFTLSSSVTGIKLSPRNTCAGANVPPSLTWSAVPSGTVELVVLVIGAKNLPHGKIFSSWAVANLSPKLSSLTGSSLPAGAIVGRNTPGQLGYSVCPKKGQLEEYFFRVFALRKRQNLKPGFSASALAEKLLNTSVAEGFLAFEYRRS
jgi:hypothetical protein